MCVCFNSIFALLCILRFYLSFARVAMAAATLTRPDEDRRFTPEVIAMVNQTMASEGGALSKWNSIAKKLLEEGIAYQIKLDVDEVLCHPLNRGGLGVNPHDCHEKLGAIREVGGDKRLLLHATCFELCPIGEANARAIKFN